MKLRTESLGQVSKDILPLGRVLKDVSYVTVVGVGGVCPSAYGISAESKAEPSQLSLPFSFPCVRVIELITVISCHLLNPRAPLIERLDTPGVGRYPLPAPSSTWGNWRLTAGIIEGPPPPPPAM